MHHLLLSVGIWQIRTMIRVTYAEEFPFETLLTIDYISLPKLVKGSHIITKLSSSLPNLD